MSELKVAKVPRLVVEEDLHKWYPKPWIALARSGKYGSSELDQYYLARPLTPSTAWYNQGCLENDPRVFLFIHARKEKMWVVRVGVGVGIAHTVDEECLYRPVFPLSQVVQQEGTCPNQLVQNAVAMIQDNYAQLQNELSQVGQTLQQEET